MPTLAQPGVPVQPHPPPSLPAEPTKPAIVDGDQKITEVDLDSLDDKPWRRPGAHQADYFNYGFDEFTWKAHCARQRDTRSESDRARDQPFSVRRRPGDTGADGPQIFATMPVQEAWNTLPPALKGALTTIVFQAVQGQGNMMPFGGMMPGMPAGMPPMGMPPGAGLPQPPHPSMHQAPSGTGQDDGFRGTLGGIGCAFGSGVDATRPSAAVQRPDSHKQVRNVVAAIRTTATTLATTARRTAARSAAAVGSTRTIATTTGDGATTLMLPVRRLQRRAR